MALIRGWCESCNLPCALDEAMLNMKTYKPVCAKCVKKAPPLNMLPVIVATLDDTLAPGSASTILMKEHMGYALIFRVPFRVEYAVDVVVVGHSTMPDTAGIGRMDEYADKLRAELNSAQARSPDMLLYENRRIVGEITASLLERPEFAKSKLVRTTLSACPSHIGQLVPSGTVAMFPDEIRHIKECPIGVPRTRVMVAPSVPVAPNICMQQATAFCELRVKAVTPGHTAVVSCAPLDLLYRFNDAHTKLVPSAVMLLSDHGWHAGVFELGNSAATISLAAGSGMDDSVFAVQWAFSTFVPSTQIFGTSSDTAFYPVEDRRREQACRLASPLQSPKESHVSMCIMLNEHTALLLGSKRDGSGLLGVTLSRVHDQVFSVFIEWGPQQWAHILSIDDLVIIVDGDIRFDAQPERVVVRKTTSRGICPISLHSAIRFGAMVWTSTGWRGQCTNLFCQCQITTKM